MNRLLILATAVCLTSGGVGLAYASPPSSPPVNETYRGAELASRARITMAQARATALNAHPGTITDQELEKEGGGSGLRYSFDIKHAGRTAEVGVDARTGKVLENKLEGSHPD